ncbi:endonuclease 8-like 1 isoform X2 [Mauremys reevesii]|uniref:endonuclease 8-like 1 isoform X2 n=1 Tax=Mauremys reevesii TaxID=260615 RepID=UPI001940060A|nr:endonuclease 8-like 1 isoform X2 [Mauremys reevesii]XP_039349285.1 endonuclease 8-like 1 isoform X2 [Mauremys reevesii]XP_039349286.1 endonuclease 8-like 1 isoform X2 [Mauremys reevesii]
MPEGPELHLASCYINTVCAGLIFSGKVEKSEVSKNPEVLFESDAYLISATSRGKEIKLTLTPLKEEKSTLPGRGRDREGLSQNGLQQPMDLVFRFGMSGSFKLTSAAELPKHAHLRFYTKESPHRALCFVDFRRFGRWEVHGTWQLDRGPCVMLEYEKFRENVLRNLSDKAFNKPICEALLNQKFFNGIGNYLRAEILYRLKIPPFEKARTVLEALQHRKQQSPDLTLSKKVKLKRENPDLLELCHAVPMEVIHMGGKGYGSEPSDDAAAFEEWLQCYCVPGMRSLRDGNGRTIWFQGEPGPMAPKGEKSRKKRSRVNADPEPPSPKVTKPVPKRGSKGSSSQEKVAKRSGRKKGNELVQGAENAKAHEARKPNTRSRRKASASQASPTNEAPAADRKRQASARRSTGAATAVPRSRWVKAE